jgi:BirA family biotin operon repressor/biotin-[acetyl-CoA-carboxylase] ligase
VTLLLLDPDAVLTSCESTQTRCVALAEAGAPEGTVVWSWEQTRGQGRGDHSWISPADAGLWISFTLRPRVPHEQRPALTALVAVAAARAIESMVEDRAPLDDAAGGADSIGRSSGESTEHAGTREPSVGMEPMVWIKWPNDLYGGRGKLGGVLAQSVSGGVVMGLGIDVWQRAGDLPPTLRGRASSLFEEGWLEDLPPEDRRGRRDAIAELAFRFDAQLESVYGRFQSGDDQFLREALLARFYLRGAEVEIEDGRTIHRGTAVDIGPAGELILESKDHRLTVRSGTVLRHGRGPGT